MWQSDYVYNGKNASYVESMIPQDLQAEIQASWPGNKELPQIVLVYISNLFLASMNAGMVPQHSMTILDLYLYLTLSTGNALLFSFCIL